MEINRSLLANAFKVFGVWIFAGIAIWAASIFGATSIGYILTGVICFVISLGLISLEPRKAKPTTDAEIAKDIQEVDDKQL